LPNQCGASKLHINLSSNNLAARDNLGLLQGSHISDSNFFFFSHFNFHSGLHQFVKKKAKINKTLQTQDGRLTGVILHKVVI